MEIHFLGHASFKLKGKKAIVVTDPYDPTIVGLKYPKTETNIVTVSHQHADHNYIDGLEKKDLVITGPGEYEAFGVKIWGIATYHDKAEGKDRGKNTVFRIEMDKISVVHLGDLGHKLTDAQVDGLDGVDVLLIPVGGYYTINAEEAALVVSQLEPKIIIPMHYSKPGMNPELVKNLAAVEEFLKEMGKGGIIPQSKLILSKDKLPVEPTVVVLE